MDAFRYKVGSCNPVNYIHHREYNDSPSTVKKLIRMKMCSSKSLFSKNLLAHFGCVNAIEFSSGGELLASGGDDRRVLLWNFEESLHGVGHPVPMRAQHISNIFCLGFDSKTTKIFSAGNDDQVIVHDIKTKDPINYFLHEQPVYSLSIDPCNDNVFASACDDGRILVFDLRLPSSSEPLVLAVCSSAFHGVTFNPIEPRLIATANSEDGAVLWDVRKPKRLLLRYGTAESCMSIRWDSCGQRLLALRRRLPPVLYSVDSQWCVAQFDHPSYYNSCTMKSCCFAGDKDQFVLSGSDDFNLYMWKIPERGSGSWVSEAHMILTGHRSIVNQVRFNPINNTIASSGVEKLIKIWSPFRLPYNYSEQQSEKPDQRKVFSHNEYVSLVLQSGQFFTHDYSHQSTNEDPRMMAFFDSLVQREIEGCISDGSQCESKSPPPLASDHSLSEDSVSCSSSDDRERFKTDLNKSKKQTSNLIVELITRKRSLLVKTAEHKQTNESNTDSSVSEKSIRKHRKHVCKQKQRRKLSNEIESNNNVKSMLSSKKKRKNVLVWNDESSSEGSDQDSSLLLASKKPSTSSETPDSGIVISEPSNSSKFKSKPHRNYRHHITDSDSD